MSVVIGILILAVILASIRFIKGPTAIDRVLIFDFLTSTSIAVTVLYAIWTDSEASLSWVTILAILAFVSSMALAAYMEWEQKRRKNDL